MFSKKDEKFFNKTMLLAMISDHYKSKIGAMLVKNNKPISIGVNSNFKTHPIQKYYNEIYRGLSNIDDCRHLIHAELECILNSNISKYDMNNQNLSIYIVRVMKDKTLANARPCKSCLAMLKDFKINHIYYSTNTGFIYEYIK